ncbi:MAG: glycosyltransferase [Anaerolineae bacterium]|nr:glycosyltransferase [Anaerolineae bacterium]
MNNKPKIAILSFSDIHSDGRVLRQIEYLSKRFTLDVIGYGYLPAALQDKAYMWPIQPPTSFARRSRKTLFLSAGKLFSALYEAWYWSEMEYTAASDLLLQSRPDAIHANDWESLPAAVRASQQTGARIVLDLHEYAPLLRENRWYWRTFYKPPIEYFLHKYIPYISASVTVNQPIAERYAKEYDLHPIVVTNAPKCVGQPPFRATDPGHIRLIHHGNADPDRGLEIMIETLALAHPRFTLHLMLVERGRGYISKLKALAQRVAPSRVFFYPPVPPAEIVPRISEFDVGFYLLPPKNFNQLAASPNKFFDFVMAGLAVCVGPSLEMARLAQQFGFGLVTPSLEPAQVADCLNSLSVADLNEMKRKAIQARNVLNADAELAKLIGLYSDLLGSSGSRVEG